MIIFIYEYMHMNMHGIIYIFVFIYIHTHVSYSELDMCIRVVLFMISELHTAVKSSNFRSISPKLIGLTPKGS